MGSGSSGGTIVIPHYGDRALTDQCLAAIADTAKGAEVIVVDNGTGDYFTCDRLVHFQHNQGFAVACNVGAERASHPVVVWLNNDTIPQPGWWDSLLSVFDDPKVGVAGARLLYPDGRVQHAGVEIGYEAGVVTARNRTFECNAGPVWAVTGACMAIRVEAFKELGGFDAGFWNGYEDVDLCLRAREAGWQVWYEPAVTLIHLESRSGPERWAKVRENIVRLHERWAGRL